MFSPQHKKRVPWAHCWTLLIHVLFPSGSEHWRHRPSSPCRRHKSQRRKRGRCPSGVPHMTQTHFKAVQTMPDGAGRRWVSGSWSPRPQDISTLLYFWPFIRGAHMLVHIGAAQHPALPRLVQGVKHQVVRSLTSRSQAATHPFGLKWLGLRIYFRRIVRLNVVSTRS